MKRTNHLSKAVRGMRNIADHMLTHKPESVTVEDWWEAVLHVHADMAIISIENEKWRLPLGGEAHEPRHAFQDVTRLGMVAMIISSYYQAQVDPEWFKREGSNILPLHSDWILRHLASIGMLPGYDEEGHPARGSGADA